MWWEGDIIIEARHHRENLPRVAEAEHVQMKDLCRGSGDGGCTDDFFDGFNA